jgi:hypothetical protein
MLRRIFHFRLPDRRRLACILGSTLALGVYIGWRSWSATALSGADGVPVAAFAAASATVAAPVEIPAVPETPPGPPAELFGSWTDRFHGTRTFRFHADGTGIMTLELDALGRLLYGRRLEFDLAWTWSDGGLDLKMVGGRPEEKTQSAAAVFGDKFRYLLLEAGPDQLKIKAADDGTEYVLERVAEVETANAPEQPLR